MARDNLLIQDITYDLAPGITSFTGAAGQVVGVVQFCSVAADWACENHAMDAMSVALVQTTTRCAQAKSPVALPFNASRDTPQMALTARVLLNGPSGAQWCGASTLHLDTDFVQSATASCRPVQMECTQPDYVGAVVSSMCDAIHTGKLCSTVKFSSGTALPLQSTCEAWKQDAKKGADALAALQPELYQCFLDELDADRSGAHIYDSMARNNVYELRGMTPEAVVGWQTQGRLCRGNMEALAKAACKMHNADPCDLVARHQASTLTDEDFNGVCLTALRMPGAAAVVYKTDTDALGRSSERFSCVVNTMRALGDSGMGTSMGAVGDCEDSAIFNACAHNSFRALSSSGSPTVADVIASRCRCQKAAIVTCAVHMMSAASARQSELMTHTTCLVADDTVWNEMINRNIPAPHAEGSVYLLEGTGMVTTGLSGELTTAPAPRGSKLEMAKRLQASAGCDLTGAMDVDAIDFYAYANTLVLGDTLYNVCTVDERGHTTKGAPFLELLKNDGSVCLRKARAWDDNKHATLKLAMQRKLACECPQLEMRSASTHACVYSASNSQPTHNHAFDQIARGSSNDLVQTAASTGAVLQGIPFGMGISLFLF